jgi:nitroreductase
MSGSSGVPRKTEAPVDRLFVDRRSTRAYSSTPVSREELGSVFEAARWSHSCYNDQPWLFVYGVEREDRSRIASLLAEGNRAWAEAAPVLGVVFARRHFAHNGKPNRWGPYDTGSAAMALSLQAHRLGLSAHYMGGFDAERSFELLDVPADQYEAMAAFSLGRPASLDDVPEDLREREKPTDRKPLDEIAFEGRFKR